MSFITQREWLSHKVNAAVRVYTMMTAESTASELQWRRRGCMTVRATAFDRATRMQQRRLNLGLPALD